MAKNENGPTCCLLFGFHLIMSGGRLKHQLPPKDTWILNLETSTWKEVKLLNDDIQNQLGQWGHTFTAITHSEGLVEVIMFGGCPGLYEVSWDVYNDFNRLSFPVSFILGLLDKEWALLDVVNCGEHWTSTSKTTKLIPFDLGSPVTLDVLYSMEQEKIPVLMELISNQKVRSTVCSENEQALYKWPTFTKASLYKPTWEKLCLILKLNDMNDLVKKIEDYLRKANQPLHILPKKRTISESDLPVAKRRRESVLKLPHSPDFKMSAVIPETDDPYTSSETKTEENTRRLSNEKKVSLHMEKHHQIIGVDVCGEIGIRITNSTQFFKWERFGLKVHIEENSLPADIEQMTVTIKASISGHYESPEGYERVSAVFWFQCEPNIELKKQVTVEIQHCAMSEHTSELSFARAMCTQEKLPYTFKLLDGGQFSNQSSYGVLSLNRFSGIAAFLKKLASLFISVKRNYYASLFYLTKESHHEVHLVVTWNTDAHLEVVREKYRDAQPGPEQSILFESNKISLNIPMEGIDCPNGWKIISFKPTVIKKQDVDDYKSGQGIPSCHLLARVVDQSTTEPLQHTITLDGAEPPHNEFNIYIDHGTQNRNRPAPEPSTSSTYCLSDVDSSVTLGEVDLLDVMSEVMSKKASYYALGRGLGIPDGELKAVQTQHHITNLDSALNDVLLLWLRQRYNTERFGPPTWRMLVKAAENRAGLNDRALAHKIAQKHTAHS